MGPTPYLHQRLRRGCDNMHSLSFRHINWIFAWFYLSRPSRRTLTYPVCRLLCRLRPTTSRLVRPVRLVEVSESMTDAKRPTFTLHPALNAEEPREPPLLSAIARYRPLSHVTLPRRNTSRQHRPHQDVRLNLQPQSTLLSRASYFTFFIFCFH